MKKYQSFLSKNFQFLEVKYSIYLNRHVFVMTSADSRRAVVSYWSKVSWVRQRCRESYVTGAPN